MNEPTNVMVLKALGDWSERYRLGPGSPKPHADAGRTDDLLQAVADIEALRAGMAKAE